MSAEKSTSLVCPICRTENRPEAAYCFLCGQSLAGAETVASNRPFPTALPGIHRPKFRLSMIVLVIALIALAFGMWRDAIGLIILLALPIAIASVRTVVVSEESDSAFHHVAVFLVTIAVVIGVAVAGFAAFCATCLAIIYNDQGFPGSHFNTGVVVGGIVAVAVMVGITVLLIRRASRRREVA